MNHLYVVQTKPGRESQAAVQLSQPAVVVYLPLNRASPATAIDSKVMGGFLAPDTGRAADMAHLGPYAAEALAQELMGQTRKRHLS